MLQNNEDLMTKLRADSSDRSIQVIIDAIDQLRAAILTDSANSDSNTTVPAESRTECVAQSLILHQLKLHLITPRCLRRGWPTGGDRATKTANGVSLSDGGGGVHY